MERRKKAICVALCLMMGLSLLTSCGTSTTTEPSAPTTAQSSASATPQGSPADVSQGASSAEPAANVNYAKEMDIIIDNNKIAVVTPFSTASNTSPTTWVFNMIYDKLVIGDGEGNYVADLATSWDTTDWKTVTMKLRDDVTFHNGEKFTASDVIYTVKTAQAATGTQVADRWGDVETVTALDDYTVQFVLKAVNVNFLYNISQPQAGIVNEKAMTEDPENGAWIGTGCWYITDFATNDYVKLARNDNYWGQKAITEKITLRYIPEQSTRLMMLQNGETDVCFAINPNDLPLIEADTENYVTYKFTYNNCDMLGFNMKDPICGDYNFRMAVASALNRDEITLAACGAYGIPESTGTFYGYATEFRNNDIPIIPFDIDKAKDYLAKSPYKGEEIVLTTAISTNITASEVIQQQLSLIGVNIKINQMDPPSIGAYAAYSDNKTQMLCFVAPQTLSAGSYRNLYYPGAGYNRAAYNNQEVTDLLDKAPTIIDAAEREKVYKDLQETIAQDPPYFNLFWLVNEAACVKGVGGMVLPADSYFDLRYIYKIID